MPDTLDDFGQMFIAIAIEAYIFNGDQAGIALARDFRDDQGKPPPIDALITDVLLLSGRLLPEWRHA